MRVLIEAEFDGPADVDLLTEAIDAGYHSVRGVRLPHMTSLTVDVVADGDRCDVCGFGPAVAWLGTDVHACQVCADQPEAVAS